MSTYRQGPKNTLDTTTSQVIFLDVSGGRSKIASKESTYRAKIAKVRSNHSLAVVARYANFCQIGLVGCYVNQTAIKGWPAAYVGEPV